MLIQEHMITLTCRCDSLLYKEACTIVLWFSKIIIFVVIFWCFILFLTCLIIIVIFDVYVLTRCHHDLTMLMDFLVRWRGIMTWKNNCKLPLNRLNSNRNNWFLENQRYSFFHVHIHVHVRTSYVHHVCNFSSYPAVH